jgi:diadenosine tetraphosphate (Ap4A) HIT family hydrolase
MLRDVIYDSCEVSTVRSCSIVADPSSAHVVIDHDACVAFLDRAPLFLGHAHVIPA